MGNITIFRCGKCLPGCCKKEVVETPHESVRVGRSSSSHDLRRHSVDEEEKRMSELELIWKIYQQFSRDETDSWRIQGLTTIMNADPDDIIVRYVIPTIKKQIEGRIFNTGSFVYDKQWRMIDRSPNLQNMLGADHKEVNVVNEYRWAEKLHREDYETTVLKWMVVKVRGGVYIHKCRFVREDGISYCFMYAVPKKDLLGRVERVDGYILEIDQDIWNQLIVY